MEYPMEEILSYALPALFVLAVFYGIYFAKMLAQKRRGIRTRQIGKRKETSIHTVEMLMYCNLLTVPLTVFAIVMLHLQILQEERYLEETFGVAYREYKRHTLRYLGRR